MKINLPSPPFCSPDSHISWSRSANDSGVAGVGRNPELGNFQHNPLLAGEAAQLLIGLEQQQRSEGEFAPLGSCRLGGQT